MAFSKNDSPVSPDELLALRMLSSKLGSDITRTQGAGGNTSVKRNGLMWVKASGTWLARAVDEDIMVPVETAPLIDAVRDRDPRAEKATDFVVADLNSSGLRPSIETSVHAVIRQPVVAHFHCVNTIAHAVLSDPAAVIDPLLEAGVPDLSWALVPYSRPGIPLAQAISEVAVFEPDILVLQNHGLVVAGQSIDEVAERIERVTKALSVTPRSVGQADIDWLSKAASGSAYAIPDDNHIHLTALDPVSLNVALSGSLYPDHVIFLGENLGVIDDQTTIDDVLKDAAAKGRPAPKMIVAPGRGVLLSTGLTVGGHTMARCLAEVVSRISAGADISYLSEAQTYELSNWEAEQYRQTLDRAASK